VSAASGAGGELVFITPRDFVKATSAVPLNRLLHAAGTITDFVDLGDSRLFDGATPNCAIWRFERDNFSRRTRYAQQGVADGLAGLARLQWEERHFVESGGHLLFTRGDYDCSLPTSPSSRSVQSPVPTISMPARSTAIAASSARRLWQR
jgi:adenine-specific DNA-methyltransferase